MDQLLERIPPQAIEAEQSVLGAMMMSQFTIDDVAAILRPSDFYRHSHQTIYRTLLDINDRNEAVDLVTVVQELRKHDQLDEAGGYSYLMDLPASIPTAINAAYYAKLVRESSDHRKTIEIGAKIAEMGYDLEVVNPLDKAAAMALEACTSSDMAEAASMSEIGKSLGAQIDAAMVAFRQYGGTRIPGRVLSGFRGLDRVNLGFGLDHLVYLAARPAMGKSSLLIQIAKNIAAGKMTGTTIPVVVFSLEMGREEIMRRLACSMTGINGQRVIRGELEAHEREHLQEAIDQLGRIPLFIDDSSDISIGRIRSVSRKIKAKHGGLGGIFVDYIQLMGATNEEVSRYKRGLSNANRQEEISKISRGLKMMAREMMAPVIAASQLSRAVEGRMEKRPMLQDLRESGSLEQDANQVAFIYRDEYYNPDTHDQGIAEIIIAKNRDGETNTVKLGFEKGTTNFFDLGQATAYSKHQEPSTQTRANQTQTSWAGTEVEEWDP